MDHDKFNQVLLLNKSLEDHKILLAKYQKCTTVSMERTNGSIEMRVNTDAMKSDYSDLQKFPEIEEAIARLSLRFLVSVKKIVELKIADIETEIETL